MSAGGVYAYRCRKPGARLSIPLLSFHWGYVGRTTSFYHRHLQHTRGVSAFGRVEAKPWTDLIVSVHRLPLPRVIWLHKVVEAVAILALMPVYNVQMNRRNPRRIRPATAIRQRAQRDAGVRAARVRPVHVVLLLLLLALVWMWIGGRA